MKRIVSLLLVSSAFALTAGADDKPVTFEQLPDAAKTFITSNFKGIKILFASMDDDLIRPDYEVRLADGTEIDFDNDGRLEKVEMKSGAVPSGIVPVQVKDYVKANYQDVLIREYEIGLRHYEVKLSNGLELKFNKSFQLIGIDD